MMKVNITTWIRLGKGEISNPLFIQSQVPPDSYIVLGLKRNTEEKEWEHDKKQENYTNKTEEKILLS